MQKWRRAVFNIVAASIVPLTVSGVIGQASASALGRYPERVYVPTTIGNTVHVIDPKTFKIINTYRVGKEPQIGRAHV